MGTRLRTAACHSAVIVLLLVLYLDIGQAGWGPWSSWTPCSVTCGSGVQKRVRHCTDDPEFKCGYSNTTQELQCYSGKMCDKQDGGWSAWSKFSNCSRRCGEGFHERWRKCNNPEPRYGGKYCNGSMYESARCINPACPPLYTGEDSTICPKGYVHCADGRQCIPEYRRCDFRGDCLDGSDESACREGEPVERLIYNSAITLRSFSMTLSFLFVVIAFWMAGPRS